MKPSSGLRASEYSVATIPLAQCRELIAAHHYAKGSANTATFRHGLIQNSGTDGLLCGRVVGCAVWIPPTKSAALATYPQDWRGVLALSRLVVLPDQPTNSASFLIGRSIRLIRQDPRWKCLVTYADDYQGHAGTIYKATNWESCGKTAPHPTWVDCDGRMVARKAGPKTRTRAQMEQLGYTMIGRFSKHKFRIVLES